MQKLIPNNGYNHPRFSWVSSTISTISSSAGTLAILDFLMTHSSISYKLGILPCLSTYPASPFFMLVSSASWSTNPGQTLAPPRVVLLQSLHSIITSMADPPASSPDETITTTSYTKPLNIWLAPPFLPSCHDLPTDWSLSWGGGDRQPPPTIEREIEGESQPRERVCEKEKWEVPQGFLGSLKFCIFY